MTTYMNTKWRRHSQDWTGLLQVGVFLATLCQHRHKCGYLNTITISTSTTRVHLDSHEMTYIASLTCNLVQWRSVLTPQAGNWIELNVASILDLDFIRMIWWRCSIRCINAKLWIYIKAWGELGLISYRTIELSCNSSWVLVGRWLLSMHVWYALGACVGGPVVVGTKNILYRFIEGRTHFSNAWWRS